MPRLPRVQPADLPQHIVQRGNNRAPCFFADADYSCYLDLLRAAALRTRVRIHGYALMPNHVHLLASPTSDGGLATMMQLLGRNYAGRINKQYGRTGTLWERRYRASLIETDAYLLEVYRYIDLNPVRAGLVRNAQDFRWSSARAHLGLVSEAIDDHPLFASLGVDAQRRAAVYRDLLESALTHNRLTAIRDALNTGQALGSDGFRDGLEMLGCGRVRHLRAGRKPLDRDVSGSAPIGQDR